MKTIELTDEQWAALQSGEDVVISKPKPKQWEPKVGDSYISSDGIVGLSKFVGPLAVGFGTVRNTKEQAEKAAKAMRRFNRLLAYRDEFDPNFEPDWSNREKEKYYVNYNHRKQQWEYDANFVYETAGTVYMSRDVAIELVKKLNSSEVVL